MESHQILQGNLNVSVRKKHTYLKKIRDSEEVYRGWEYQLKYVEKGLGIFLRPLIIRKNKDTIHEYCTELADILLYQTDKTSQIKNLDGMLIGKVIIHNNDKDRAYQIVKISREKCPELPEGSNLHDEYEEEYLDNVKVDLKEWLGRPVSLTELEERVELKDISLKEIYEIYHNVF